MKVVIHTGGRGRGLSSLTSSFPDVNFVFTNSLAELSDALPGAEVLITPNRPFVSDMAKVVHERQTNLRWIAFTTSGIDSALKSRGIPKGTIVTNAAGISGPILAEHAFAFFLFLGRQFAATRAAAARREWVRDEITPSMVSLYGRTLAIFGMGAAGQAAARLGKAFRMKVIAVSRSYAADDFVDRVFTREEAKPALAEADFILLSMPSTPETRHFFDADMLAAAKRTAILVNIARGDLIDTSALAQALAEGRLGGAGLDVTEQEPLPHDSALWSTPNLVVTPHIAATGANLDDALHELIAKNLSLYLEGKQLNRTLDWETM